MENNPLIEMDRDGKASYEPLEISEVSVLIVFW